MDVGENRLFCGGVEGAEPAGEALEFDFLESSFSQYALHDFPLRKGFHRGGKIGVGLAVA